MRIIQTSLFALGLGFFLSGCYTPKEGCLDAGATNFDLDADKACSDCCTYPTLKIALQHRVLYPTADYKLGLGDSIYYDAVGQPYRLKDIRYYLSNIHLVRPDGSEAELEDRIELNVPNPAGGTLPIEVEDNFLLVNPRLSQTFTLGILRAQGPFDRVRFTIGIEEPANFALPEKLPTGHPLQLQTDFPMYFNADSGYVFNKIALLRDTTVADSIPVVLSIGTTPFLRTYELVLPQLFEPVEGFSTLLTIRVDYGRWFRNINARQDSPAQLIQKIMDNLEGAFEVLEIKRN